MYGLKRLLKKLQREANPSTEFKAELLSRLNALSEETRPAVGSRFRIMAVGLASLILVFGMGTGVYAYESPDVTEGHPLYFVKQRLEQVEGSLATTPSERAQYHERMMERRMAEAELLVQQQDKLSVTLEKAATEFDQSTAELPSVEANQRTNIVERLSQQNTRYESVLERVRMNGTRRLPSPEAAQERLNSLRHSNSP